MKCEACDGKGFVEYDAGLLVIGCKTCSGIGKVNCELTKEEFESGYAFRSDMTVDQVREMGLEAVACESDCSGWAMQKIEVAPPAEEPEPETAPEVKVFSQGIDETLLPGGSLAWEAEVADDSDSGIGPDNKPAGSGDTSQPKQPKKPKAKKKARKKSS